MSIIKNKDLHPPMNGASIRKLIGLLNRFEHEQTAAASAAGTVIPGTNPVKQDHIIQDLFFIATGAAAAGESMTIDVLRNGVSILTGVFTYDSTKTAKKQLSLMNLLTAAGKKIAAGDVLTATRVYTAGGGPTPIANNAVVVELGPASTVD